MYKLKQTPEDFIVKEITNLELRESGDYLVCILKKTNYTTIRAIEQIARTLNKNIKDIGFAGTKDKNAVTEQYISIKNTKKEEIERIKLKDIELKAVGYLDKPISLGDLKENEFTITIRNFKDKLKKQKLMPNLFGEQRFSKNNVEIGKALLKPNFKQALKLILKTNIDYKEQLQESIKEKPNDFIKALKLIPIKLLKLYVHSYQSHLWNQTLEEYTKHNKENIKLPLIGFGTEIENKKIEKITNKLMEKESITFRSFINRSIPEISLEGGLRDAFVEIKDLKVLEKDPLKISFKLKKGSYATVAIEFLLNPL